MSSKLFDATPVLEVVKAQDIRDLTGIKTGDFEFAGTEDQADALDKLLENWIEKVASHIYIRISRTVDVTDGEFLAIQDVLVRTVANLVAVAQQQRTSPVVQIDSFAVNILNTGEVTKELDNELEPFIRYKSAKTKAGRMNVFSSLEEYTEEV